MDMKKLVEYLKSNIDEATGSRQGTGSSSTYSLNMNKKSGFSKLKINLSVYLTSDNVNRRLNGISINLYDFRNRYKDSIYLNRNDLGDDWDKIQRMALERVDIIDKNDKMRYQIKREEKIDKFINLL